MVKTILVLIGWGTLTCSAWAVPLPRNNDAARVAAVRWLQLLDAGRVEEGASQGSPEVRSLEQWRDYLKTHRTMLGPLNKRQFVEMKHIAVIPGVPEVRPYYILRFKSSFEHHPAALELITITKIGCCWEVFDYKVES